MYGGVTALCQITTAGTDRRHLLCSTALTAAPCMQQQHAQQELMRCTWAQDRFDLPLHAARMARLDSARQADHRAAGVLAAAAHPGRIAA